MKAIGGYFELELCRGSHSYHTTPYTLKSGRSALNFILNTLTPSLVYIPFYTCDVLLDAFTVSGICYKFYEIGQDLEPLHLPELQENELFLYINYFDIKRDLVFKLSELYKEKLIVDCSQAFFMRGNGKSWFFNSCRKFFGVPDGAFLYAPVQMELSLTPQKNNSYFFDHLLKRFNGDIAEGYDIFVENEIACGPEYYGMSKVSEYLLSNVDYDMVIARRRTNFETLHRHFKTSNSLVIKDNREMVPMCYPYFPEQQIKRELLYTEQIFIPFFWKDVLSRQVAGYYIEKDLAQKLLPCPVDHRYAKTDIERLIHNLKKQP